MSKALCALALALFANGCAISASVGGGPASPAAMTPAAYVPPSTAHPAPAAVPAPAPAHAAAPPPPTATPQPVREPARAGAAVQPPASQPAAGPSYRSAVPPEPKKNKKLRFKDTWVEQTHPENAPRMEKPASRVARAP